jgi:N-acetylmuramoyl-L-alanine amidase
MRLFLALTLLLTGRAAFAGAETANPFFFDDPAPAEEVKPPVDGGNKLPVSEQKPVAQATDIFADNAIVRRWQWTNTPAQRLPDDECYNYFNLYGKPKVSQKDSVNYVKALQSVYQGGRIIIHHTGSDLDSAQDVLQNHQKQKWGDMGYHFYIRKDCSILEGRPLHMMGTHAGHMPLRIGQCERDGQSGYDITNDFDFKAIGIVMEGNSDVSDPTAACGEQLKKLILSLHKTFGIDKIGGHGHYKADGTATECPGDHIKEWMSRNLGPSSGMKFEGASDTDAHSLVNLIQKANGGGVTTAAMQHQFETGMGFEKTQNAPSIPANTVPVNDLNGRSIMCSHCEQ